MMLSNLPKVLTLSIAIGIALVGCNKAEDKTPSDQSAAAPTDTHPTETGSDTITQNSSSEEVAIDADANKSSQVQGSANIASDDSSKTSADTSPNKSVGLDTAKAIVIPMAKTTMQLTATAYESVLTEDEKSCLLQNDYDNAVMSTQRYLSEKMTSDELAAADKFYTSATGKKLGQLTLQQSDIVVGKQVTNPIELSQSEQNEIQEFLKSKAGQKLAQTFSPDKEQQVTSTILEPSIEAALKHCNVSDKIK